MHSEDFHLAQECLEGNPQALEIFQKNYREPVTAFLQRSGAAPHEAREVVSDLWADCFSRQSGAGAKLAHYNGTCTLLTWLNTVALNDLLTRKRREERWHRLVPGRIATAETDLETEGAPGFIPDSHDPEPASAPLLEIMKNAIEAAFRECPAEDFVLLQLSHYDELKVKELGLMFGCDPGTISRRVQRAEAQIQAATERYVRAADPWLELRWEDFIELCRTASPAIFGQDED